MQTPIDYGKEFLVEYFRQRNKEAVMGMLSEDLVWVTSGGLYHLRTKKETEEFLETEMKDHPAPCNVDVISIMSPPCSKETISVVYELNLIPADSAEGTYLRISLAVRQWKDRQEINFIHVSSEFGNAQEMREGNKKMKQKLDVLGKHVLDLQKEKRRLSAALEEAKAEKIREEQQLRNEHAEKLAETDRLHAAEMQALQKNSAENLRRQQQKMVRELESQRKELQKAAEKELRSTAESLEDRLRDLEEQLADQLTAVSRERAEMEEEFRNRKLLESAQVRNELEAEQKKILAGYEADFEQKVRDAEKELELEREKLRRMKEELQAAKAETAEGLQREEVLQKEREELKAAYEKKLEEKQSALEAGAEELHRAEIRIEEFHRGARAEKEELIRLRKENSHQTGILSKAEKDKEQLFAELKAVTYRLERMMRLPAETGMTRKRRAGADMLEAVRGLVTGDDLLQQPFRLEDCLDAVEVFAAAACRERGLHFKGIEKHGELPEYLEGDKIWLELILLDLLEFVCRQYPESGKKSDGILFMQADADRPVREQIYLRFTIEDPESRVRELVGPSKEELSYMSGMLGRMRGSLQVRRKGQSNAMEAVVTVSLKVSHGSD